MLQSTKPYPRNVVETLLDLIQKEGITETNCRSCTQMDINDNPNNIHMYTPYTNELRAYCEQHHIQVTVDKTPTNQTVIDIMPLFVNNPRMRDDHTKDIHNDNECYTIVWDKFIGMFRIVHQGNSITFTNKQNDIDAILYTRKQNDIDAILYTRKHPDYPCTLVTRNRDVFTETNQYVFNTHFKLHDIASAYQQYTRMMHQTKQHVQPLHIERINAFIEALYQEPVVNTNIHEHEYPYVNASNDNYYRYIAYTNTVQQLLQAHDLKIVPNQTHDIDVLECIETYSIPYDRPIETCAMNANKCRIVHDPITKQPIVLHKNTHTLVNSDMPLAIVTRQENDVPLSFIVFDDNINAPTRLPVQQIHLNDEQAQQLVDVWHTLLIENEVDNLHYLGSYTYEFGNPQAWETFVKDVQTAATVLTDDERTALNALLDDEGERAVRWLRPFMQHPTYFKRAVAALLIEHHCLYDSDNLYDLQNEAYEKYNDPKWFCIQEIVTLYVFQLNGRTHFIEFMNENE